MRKDKQVELVFYFVGAVFIAWLSVLVAPCIHKGLFDAIIYLNEAMNSPFSFELCQDTLKCILISESIYSFSYLTYYYNRKNYRRNEEYGSAKWANNKAVNKKYTEKDYYSNKILSQNVRIGLDGRRHRRNLNTLVIGGSGAGKTRFFGKPNLMQCNTSFVVLDPKGEQLRDVGNLLEKEGYVNTKLYDPSGYDMDAQTTVLDLAKLVKKLLKHQWFRDIVSQSSYTAILPDGSKQTWENTNIFLDSTSEYYNENVLGVKTGSLSDDYNLIVLYKKHGKEFLICSLGSQSNTSRYDDVSYILKTIDESDYLKK